MIKNTLYFLGSILVFFTGTIVYGVILNSADRPINEVLADKRINDFSKIHLVVYQQKYRLDLYSDTVFIKSYHVVFGRSSTIPRILKNRKTLPPGKYRICEVDINSKYRKFLKLNYPRINDLEEAAAGGYISQDEFHTIYNNMKNNDCDCGKKLGSIQIGIHGIGDLDFIFRNLPFVYNWTNGSIAVNNDGIDEIYSVIKIGTEVVIKN